MVNKKMVHNGQKTIIESFDNVAAKVSDSAWRIVKRRSSGDISIPISVAMIIWKLTKPQQTAAIFTE
jgi:hypothetical protein